MKQEIRATLRSPQFWLAAAIFFLSFYGYSLPRWLQDAPVEYKDSALQLSLGGIYFGGIQLVLSFCASMMAALRQVDELRGGVVCWRSLRLGLRGYARRKLLCAALTAGLAMGGAFFLQAILWNLIALPADPVLYPMHYNYFSEGSLHYDWYTVAHALPIYIFTGLGIALNGACVAWLSLAVAVWMPDKLLALMAPALLINAYSDGLLFRIFGLKAPSISDLYNDGLTAEVLWKALAVLAGMMALSAAAYRLGLEKRVRRG